MSSPNASWASADDRADPLARGDRRLVGVGDAQAAAEVVDLEVAQRLEALHGGRPGRGVEELRAEVEVQADDVHGGRRVGEQRRGLVRQQAELGGRPARLDARVGVDVDPGDDADQRALAADAEVVELLRVGAVEDDQPDARIDGGAQLVRRLRVAVQDDLRGIEPGGQREVQLAARRHVDHQPLLGEDPQRGGAREGLASRRRSAPRRRRTRGRGRAGRPPRRRRRACRIPARAPPRRSPRRSAARPRRRRPADTRWKASSCGGALYVTHPPPPHPRRSRRPWLPRRPRVHAVDRPSASRGAAW